MIHPKDIPFKQEVYSIAARPPTAEELELIVSEIEEETSVFHEDPRFWPNYDVFLGHQISKAMFRYQIPLDMMPELMCRLLQTLDKDRPELLSAAIAARDELQRLRDVRLPRYEGKIGEPNKKVLDRLSAAIKEHKPNLEGENAQA